MESMQDLWRDLSPLTTDMFQQLVYMLNDMEEKGYFGFVQQSAYVMDQIVTSFSEEDVRLLGDNVVLILNTVKALTQPEVMNLVNNLTEGFQEVDEHADELPTSTFGSMKQMNDPDVRRGLAITMAMLKRVSQQHAKRIHPAEFLWSQTETGMGSARKLHWRGGHACTLRSAGCSSRVGS